MKRIHWGLSFEPFVAARMADNHLMQITLVGAAVLYPAPPFPGGTAGIQVESRWLVELVGIRVDSHLIPSKNKGKFQTQIFICSRSFQVIPGGIRVKSEQK